MAFYWFISGVYSKRVVITRQPISIENIASELSSPLSHCPNFYLSSRQLDIYAADILDLCYEENEVTTLQWLNEKSTIYHDHQAAVLIDDLCPKQVLSTKCIQTYMNSRWYGDQFHRDKNFTWEILVRNDQPQ